MASEKIRSIVEKFVADILEAADEVAVNDLNEKVREFVGAAPGDLTLKPIKRRKTTKGYTVLRPCPIPGCKETAAPRWGAVCKGHKDLPREEILVARDNAAKPGGVWFDLKPRRKVS
jgi:hypothetical protein